MIDQVVDWFGKDVKISNAGDRKCEVTVTATSNAMEYWTKQYLNYVEIKTPIGLQERIKNNLR